MTKICNFRDQFSGKNINQISLLNAVLDFATTEALKNNTLQPYTTEMSEAAHQLIEGVQLDDE